MGGDDARSRRAKRAAATAVVAAAGLGFGVAALGLGAAALAAGEWRHRRDGRGAFAAASPGRRRRPLSDREWRGAIDREGRGYATAGILDADAYMAAKGKNSANMGGEKILS